jgi:sulfur carrier protein ThiS
MRLYIQKTQEHKELAYKGKVIDLLRMFSLNPETVLVTKNGTLVAEDDMLAEGDHVEILQVVSGG